MLWHYHPLEAEAMGDSAGVLRFDATGFVTKGMDSVGGCRQDGRPLGQVENGQVDVFPGYASRYGYALVRTTGASSRRGGCPRRRPPDGPGPRPHGPALPE
jgi:hypothetical protein